MPLAAALLLLLLAISAGFVLWRLLSRRRSLPCPSWLSWMVDNPLARGRTNATLAQLELSPGLHVLDAGCGPGRLSIPIAQAVAPLGHVLALDIQPEMLRRTRQKASDASVSNVEFLHAALGGGRLPAETFDRAVLVTVLGEIPDREGALQEIYASLKPGGFLLVNEVMGDPHYQSVRKVSSLAEKAGFRAGPVQGRALSYFMRLEKPPSAEGGKGRGRS